MADVSHSRSILLHRDISLNAILLGYNAIEGVVAIGFGLVASSVALISFGLDSLIEITSAAIVTWRLWRELKGQSQEHAEAPSFPCRSRRL